MATRPVQLSQDEVHIWLATPSQWLDPEVLKSARACLSQDELDRGARYRRPEDAHTHLVTRAMVRNLLSRYADQDPSSWRFTIQEHGKPELHPDHASRLRFNLSHTRGLVACAIAQDRDVGVDVEDLSRRAELVRIADRFFSPSECRALLALPEAEQRDRFFAYWTLKEAYIKARGLGLAIPLGHFSFQLEPGAAPAIAFAPELPDDPTDWQFHEQRQGESHRLALALRRRGADHRISVRAYSPSTAP